MGLNNKKDWVAEFTQRPNLFYERQRHRIRIRFDVTGTAQRYQEYVPVTDVAETVREVERLYRVGQQWQARKRAEYLATKRSASGRFTQLLQHLHTTKKTHVKHEDALATLNQGDLFDEPAATSN